jgi:hypothetical protein
LTSSLWTPYPSLPPSVAKAHSLRHSSSRSEIFDFLAFLMRRCSLYFYPNDKVTLRFGHLWFSKEKLELCRLPSRFQL